MMIHTHTVNVFAAICVKQDNRSQSYHVNVKVLGATTDMSIRFSYVFKTRIETLPNLNSIGCVHWIVQIVSIRYLYVVYYLTIVLDAQIWFKDGVNIPQ